MTIKLNIPRVLTFSKLIQFFIFLAICVSPLMNISEVILLITKQTINQSSSVTPIYIKALKDLCFISIILISIFHILTLNKINKIILYSILYIILLIIYPLFFLENSLIYLSGVRWIIPVILLFLLVPHITNEFMLKITEFLFFIFIIHFLLQLVELFYATSHFGNYSNGLSKRNPGMFLIPSTGALFTLFVFFFHMFYAKKTMKRTLIFLLTPISIALTQSGMGVIVYFVIMSIYLFKMKYFKLLPFIGILLFLFSPILLNIFVQRDVDNYIDASFGTRIDIFLNSIYGAELFSRNFGVATNIAVLLLQDSQDSVFVADSIYTSLVTNLGLFTSFLVFIFIFIFLVLAFINKKKDRLIFYIIILLSGATIILFEAYPMNLLIAIIFAYHIKQYNEKKLNETPNNP